MEKAKSQEITCDRVCESAYKACVDSKGNTANCKVQRNQCSYSCGGPF